MSDKESNLKQCIKHRTVNSSIIYSEEYLGKFFDKLKEEEYTGPIKKSMFLQHSMLMRKCKEIGVKLHKNRRNGYYYVDIIRFSEPFLFDSDKLVLPKEDTEKV